MDEKTGYEILFYKTETEKSPVREFLDGLPSKARSKILRWCERLSVYGPDLPRPYADTVRGKIRELRVIFASTQYRLLYFFSGKYIVVTHGFIKKTDEVPSKELEKAINIMRDFEIMIRERGVEI
ncbi:MAG: type II toxin-antitoxin system RelE/ParE family toxin [Candidatus Omnitrophica bacterium]|jgi:phage-related protein|nr:type II toxin-antitoxin system RelE/ParE family toxin [Candidatus Omnitrophota bacterium]MDD5079518.1 type II toxin-antitoxin system RelE/ParE family toxin [Candidatus Omnitrophota bacterium]